jgi:hypothetical protein
MLKIKLELHPFGDSSRKRTLGELDIWNKGTGDQMFGDYGYRINESESQFAQAVEGEGEIDDWKRDNPGFLLVWRALEDYFSKEKKVLDTSEEL